MPTKQEEITGGQTYCSKSTTCIYWGKPECPFRYTGKAYSECTAFRDTPLTKQKEIREGIARILYYLMNPYNDRDTVEREKYPFKKRYYDTAKQILIGEDEQGVVIKVEGELPDMGYLGDVVKDKTWFREGYRESQQDMLKAGYVATEPLIEVK